MILINEGTIAAISTPFGTAGIGKIRVSGPAALKLAERVFRDKNKKKKDFKVLKSHTVHYGYVVDPGKKKIADEVICIIMKGPNSFTGEDVVEFDCHGGMVPLKRVLEIILQNGARMAEPGEFSKRAFLNGRIDLSQAEGIIDIINSKTGKGLDLALEHLGGKLSSKIEDLKEKIILLLAHLEAAIDFPEDEIEGFNSEETGERLDKIKRGIEELLESSNQGKIYREGIKTVIVGKPNVGKSSLLNVMLEEKRAIVTEIPGTTRDIIEEYINIDGIPLKIIDTAGIRETEDLIEKIGVEKTRESLMKADLILMMLDITQGITKADLEIYKMVKDKPVIIIINKIDLSPLIDDQEMEKHFRGHIILKISVKEEKGLKELKTAIMDEVLNEKIKSDDEILITRTRHRDALIRALEALNRVIETHDNGLPYDFFTIDLKECLNFMGEITGETLSEDIVDKIFSEFCIGK